MRQKSKMAKICVKFPLNIHCGGCKSPLPGVSGQRWMPPRRSPWQAEISVMAPIHTIEPYLCRFDAYLWFLATFGETRQFADFLGFLVGRGEGHPTRLLGKTSPALRVSAAILMRSHKVAKNHIF